MAWKQPIPTNLLELCDGDHGAALLFMLLFYKASNKKTTVYVGDDPIKLEPGQCTVGRYELAKWFCLKQNESLRVYRRLVRLQKVNNLVNICRHKYCSIVTINNYTNLVKMNNRMNNSRTTGEQLVNTNKSVKSVKKEETTKNKFIKHKDLVYVGEDIHI